MSINDLTSLVTILLAISLATERIVTVFKTLLPELLADEKKTEALEVDLVRDRWRRFGVQIISFLAAWFTSAFLVESGFDLLGDVQLGNDTSHKDFPVWALGILSTGGSAFWSNILGYTRAVKDIRVQQKAKESLEYHQQAEELGVEPIDSGMAARSRRLGTSSAQFQEVLTNINNQVQPTFNLSQSRLI